MLLGNQGLRTAIHRHFRSNFMDDKGRQSSLKIVTSRDEIFDLLMSFHEDWVEMSREQLFTTLLTPLQTSSLELPDILKDASFSPRNLFSLPNYTQALATVSLFSSITI